MFKKLRNHFLILNMTIISVLLLSAFGIVYAITAGNTNQDIAVRLNSTLFRDMPRPDDTDGRPPRGLDLPPDEAPPDTEAPQAPKLSANFTVETDSGGTITRINSAFEIEEDVYQTVVQQALASDGERGTIRSEHTHWAYQVLRLNDGSTKIAFLDVSSEHDMLRRLTFTFLLVGALALGIIFLISLFFANRSIRPIAAAWDKQNRFIADASHELKTPLTTINANIDVLLSHPDSTIAQENKWLQYIKGETERMTALTTDLLYLAKLDAEAEPHLLYTDFSFSDMVESVLLTMEAVLFEKKIYPAEEITPGLFVHGNEGQLKQMVLILLDNAVKYTDSGGEITVSLIGTEKHAVLSVTNTGSTIAPEDQAKIFDRFYRADQSRARESGGYGLGLAIAKSIVEQHHGSIRVSSPTSSSTCFTVQLPRRRSIKNTSQAL